MRSHPVSLDYLPLPVPGYPHFDTRQQLIIREQQYLNIKLEKTTSYEIVCSTYLKLCFLLSSVHHLNNHSEQESRKLYLYFNYFFNRSEEHTSELQSRGHLVCRLLLEK